MPLILSASDKGDCRGLAFPIQCISLIQRNQLYDGMQLFNAGGVTQFPFDPWNVDRIEVLSGSSSTLYGTGGVGGAINVIPKEPNTTKQTGAFQESIGSFGTVHTAAEVTGPITPQWSHLFDVSQNSSNGWTQPNGDSKSLALSGALRYETPDFVVTLRDDYENIYPSVYEGTPTYKGNIIDAFRFINYNPIDSFVNFRENRLQLKEEWSINSNVSLTNDSYNIISDRLYHDCPDLTSCRLPTVSHVPRVATYTRSRRSTATMVS